MMQPQVTDEQTMAVAMSQDNPYMVSGKSDATLDPTLEYHPPQSVAFVPVKEDLLAVYEFLNKENPSIQSYLQKRQRRLLLTALLMGVIASLLAVFSGGDVLFAVLFGSMAVSVGVTSYILPRNNAKVTKRIAQNMLENESSKLLSTNLRVTLQAEGFEVANDDGHSFRKWSSVPKVTRLGDQLLVYVAATSAQGVPASFFIDEASFNAFCSLAERLWQESRAVEPQ